MVLLETHANDIEGFVDGICKLQKLVLVLIDHLHGHEALACVGEGDGDRAGVEIEHRSGVEGVAIEPDHGLIVDPRDLAAMAELADPAAVLDQPGEIQIGFRANEVVGGDGNRRARLRLR